MAVNVALLNKVMEHIEAHPEEHDQDQWVQTSECGTICCFAGHTVLIAGWDPMFEKDGTADYCKNPKSGGVISVEAVAGDELGLDHHDRERIFWEATTAADIRKIVDELTAGALTAGARR